MNDYDSFRSAWEEAVKMYREQKAENDRLRADLATMDSNHRAMAKLLAETGRERDRLRKAIADIQRATVEGRVCDDVAWFDGITTLYDFCDLTLNRLGTAARSLSPANTGGEE